ncbi:MAG TPA: formimidoylglutamate deiminase [Rhodanobacteraceae bacterium]|nr:formimidoylglutamate deiminase [Rhodanobacteraceae bacterium]
MDANTVYAGNLFTPDGWRADAQLRIEDGRIAALATSARATDAPTARLILPGMPNLHSHAFQRAMAGLAERSGDSVEACGRGSPLADSRDRGRSQKVDSFWTWRETMYAFASRIAPGDLRAIAAQLYVEMLKAGYTHVCEFHYLHHAPNGKPYPDPAEMSLAIIEAAREAGIGLTLLPVLYMSGGFDGRPLSERQRRFGTDVESYLRLLERARALESPMLRVGIALHSLRAVPEAAMREVLGWASSQASIGGAASSRHPASSPVAAHDAIQGIAQAQQLRPIHIHVAEQLVEVEECLALRGARPVQWLLDHAEVNANWCLVHATHLDANEIRTLAASGAVAGLCPTTEANLGDGLFPLANFMEARGTLGIGSDSHISVSPVEELRWLEYGQRLVAHQRNIAARAAGVSVAETLWKAALHGGAQASGLAPFGIGARADLLVLDEQSPSLAARDERNALDSFVFAGNTPLVRDVMVNGEWVVRDFRHRGEAAIAERYRHVVKQLAPA